MTPSGQGEQLIAGKWLEGSGPAFSSKSPATAKPAGIGAQVRVARALVGPTFRTTSLMIVRWPVRRSGREAVVEMVIRVFGRLATTGRSGAAAGALTVGSGAVTVGVYVAATI
jgi:hypothetical protein